MANVWEGAGRRATHSDFEYAASHLNVDVATVKAVWEVEAAGRPFRSDNTVERRFEPHHFPKECWKIIGFSPNGKAPWRASLALSRSARETMFDRAAKLDLEAACSATSWGGPQIMGFNATPCGFTSARVMVEFMAESEGNQISCFVQFCRDQGLATYLRARDWAGFARRYNGNGQVSAYAGKLEAAYRRQGGSPSPVIIKLGSNNADVKRLQRALGIEDDGIFGRETDNAVRAFQKRKGLVVDGKVGAKTWEQLDAIPETQKTKVGNLLTSAVKNGGTVTGVLATVEAAQRVLPAHVVTVASYVGIAVGTIIVSVILYKWVRKTLA